MPTTVDSLEMDMVALRDYLSAYQPLSGHGARCGARDRRTTASPLCMLHVPVVAKPTQALAGYQSLMTTQSASQSVHSFENFPLDLA